MDYCVTLRMATCKSTLLSRELSAARSKRYNDLQVFRNQCVICTVALKLTHRCDSAFIARSRRMVATRGFIRGDERKSLLDDSTRCPVFHGTVHSLQKRSRCHNDNGHANGVVVLDDDVDDHRKVLERFFNENIETVLEDEVSGKDEHSRRLSSSATMVRWEQDSMEETKEMDEDEASSWWRKLILSCQVTPRARGIILLNLLTFLYGSNISVIKIAGAEMDPTLFSVGRFAIASLVLAPFLRTAILNQNLVNISVELGLWASLGYLTQCIAVLTSEASRVSFISTFTVIVVPLLAGLSGVKITKITWGAAFTALVGVAFLESSGTPFAIGDVWSFVSAIMFGVHMLRTEQHSVDFLPKDSLSIISLQLVVITFCSGMWSIASHVSSGDFSIGNMQAVNWPHLMQEAAALPWLTMLYTGFLTTAFCLWCELVSLRDVKATEAAVIYTLEPLWGAAFAWILMGERWGPNGWLGAIFILSGSLTMQLFGHSESPAKEKIIPDSHPRERKSKTSRH